MEIVICIIGLAILVYFFIENLVAIMGIVTLVGIVALFTGEVKLALCCLVPAAVFDYWLMRDPMKKKITLSDPTLEKCSLIRLRMYNNDGSEEYYHWFSVDDKTVMRDYADKVEKYQYFIDSGVFNNDSYWTIDESSIELYDKQKNKLPIDWTHYAYSFYHVKDGGCGFIDVWPRGQIN